MKLTDLQRETVERIHATASEVRLRGTHGRNAVHPPGSPRRPGWSLGDQAATFAHDNHTTLGEAARRFGLSRQAVSGAWKRLYPNEPRVVRT